MFFIFAAMSKLLLELRDSNPYLAPALYLFFCFSICSFNAFLITSVLVIPSFSASFVKLSSSSVDNLKVNSAILDTYLTPLLYIGV